LKKQNTQTSPVLHAYNMSRGICPILDLGTWLLPGAHL
jgi:hypothetical protein